MPTPPSPEDRNYVLACVVQSLVGELTPNFQRVSYTLIGSLVKIRFDLKTGEDADLEDIEEVIFNLVGLFCFDYEVEHEVIVGNWDDLDKDSNVVIQMKT